MEPDVLVLKSFIPEKESVRIPIIPDRNPLFMHALIDMKNIPGPRHDGRKLDHRRFFIPFLQGPVKRGTNPVTAFHAVRKIIQMQIVVLEILVVGKIIRVTVHSRERSLEDDDGEKTRQAQHRPGFREFRSRP